MTMESKPDKAVCGYDRVIIGVDPGTNIMGYAVLGILKNKPEAVALGVIELGKLHDQYMRLGRIHERISMLVEQYCPDEMAIEAPFFGKNVQSMLKLGRAQGVAIAAAIEHEVPITEYEPRTIKMAITGNGAASKEQVREMLKRILGLSDDNIPPQLDSTDALGAALCHFYEGNKLRTGHGVSSWKAFIAQHPDRVKGM